MDKLDEVANKAHDGEPDSDGFADLDKFCDAVGHLLGRYFHDAPFCDGLVQRVRNYKIMSICPSK